MLVRNVPSSALAAPGRSTTLWLARRWISLMARSACMHGQTEPVQPPPEGLFCLSGGRGATVFIRLGVCGGVGRQWVGGVVIARRVQWCTTPYGRGAVFMPHPLIAGFHSSVN